MPEPKSELSLLHERFGPGLVRHFQRRLSSASAGRAQGGDLAQELAQRTWIEFWHANESGAYDPKRAKPSTFLYAIASIIWLRNLRERGRAGRIGQINSNEEWISDATGLDTAGALELAESIQAISDLVAGVDATAPFCDEDRQVLRAISQEKSEREIAQELQVSPSTAHQRKKALLERVAGFLKGRGFDFSPVGRARQGSSDEERTSSTP